MHFLLSISIIFVALFYCCKTRIPDEYSDYYVRHKIWPLTYLSDTRNESHYNQFLNDCFYNATFIKHVELQCDLFNTNPNITCAGSVFVTHDDQAVVLVFRATTTEDEYNEEIHDYNYTVPFPGGGTVHKFYYDGFLIIWNGGLRDAVLAAKNTYPNYDLWVTGASMGGSLSGMAAAYISKLGYFPPNSIKMISFGELRIGYMDFATLYENLVPYAYRVVHRNDAIPHRIPLEASYRHHKKEIWYNNSMEIGLPYIECDQIESLNCSDSVPPSQWNASDHTNYFYNSANSKCLKFINPPYYIRNIKQ